MAYHGDFYIVKNNLVFLNQLFYVCEDNCETARYPSRGFCWFRKMEFKTMQIYTTISTMSYVSNLKRRQILLAFNILYGSRQ